MEAGTVTELITTVGFPIFVAIWMLFKSSKDSEDMRETINELKQAINTLTALINQKDNRGE